MITSTIPTSSATPLGTTSTMFAAAEPYATHSENPASSTRK
jgi:hypothetical protein